MNLSNHASVVKDLVMQEIWKPIPGVAEGYEISSLGKVRSWRRKQQGRVLRPKEGLGYLRVTLLKNGKMTHLLVHRLVLEAFIGPCPEGQECRHLNGKRDDNRLENLCWSTHVENMADRIKHGTSIGIRGEDHACSKLTEVDVKDIRVVLAEGEFSQQEIADAYGVSRRTIGFIKTGQKWKHI